ncbi:MAG: pilus assembly protein PilP [Thermodesulfobacteriota bacterium]
MADKRFLLVLVLAFILAACEGEKPQAPGVTLKRPAAKVAAKEEPRKEQKAEIAFSYTPEGKSDPFKPFIEIAPSLPLLPLSAEATRVLPGSPLPGRPGEAVAAKSQGRPDKLLPQLGRPELPLGPLQRFDLKDLKVVGIITHREGNRALIVDLQGKGYIVSEGTAIGLRNGSITRITRTEIVVEEEEVSAGGKVTEKNVVMAIGKGLERERK